MNEAEKLNETIKHFTPLIKNLLSKYGTLLLDDRDDVEQEIYIKMLTVIRAKKRVPLDKLYPYLNTCIKNVVMDSIRKISRNRLNLIYNDTVCIQKHNIFIREPLQQLLEGLNEQEQQIACLYMDGLYQSEIGKILGISQQTISNKLKIIRKKIAQNM